MLSSLHPCSSPFRRWYGPGLLPGAHTSKFDTFKPAFASWQRSVKFTTAPLALAIPERVNPGVFSYPLRSATPPFWGGGWSARLASFSASVSDEAYGTWISWLLHRRGVR